MTRVLLLGGGVAAYAAALDLAEVGIDVRIADVTLRLPEAPVRDETGAVRGLLRELAAPLTPGSPAAPEAAPRESRAPETVLCGRDGAWAAAPVPAVWGIPAVPLARDCLALFGRRGAFRAFIDRVKPVLTIGKEENLKALVDSRLGRTVQEVAVTPLVAERFGVPTEHAEVSVVAHGLNEALTRAGSLSGAALQQYEDHVARETRVAPECGWPEFGTHLRERLRLFGATAFPEAVVGIVSASPNAATDHAVTDAVPGDAAAQQPDTDTAAVGAATAPAQWVVTDATGATHVFDAIVTDLEAPCGLLAALHPSAVREYAQIGIHAHEVPAALRAAAAAGEPLALIAGPGGESSVGAGGVRAAADTTDSRTGAQTAPWTARLVGEGSDSPRIQVTGPARAVAAGEWRSGAASADSLPAAVRAGVADAFGIQSVTTMQAEWRVSTRAATPATVDGELRFAQAHAEFRKQQPTLLVADEAAHGDDLAIAIREAREWAVALRRKLTGISE